MSQSRPSPSSRPSREESQDPSPAPGAPSSPSADPAVSPAGRAASAIPSHQSRPGPEDDIMLATGRPRGAPESATVRERIEAAKAEQERIRRRPGRKAWVPNQHGAYSMLVLPPVIGWIVGGFSWVNLLLLPAWWDAYLTYWAWSQWLRTRSPRRRRLLLLPLLVYTCSTACLGLITLLVAPYLLGWAVPLVPLFAVAAWEVWRGRERSLLSGLATTAAASLMSAVTYSLAVGGAGGFLGTGGASGLPGSSPNGALTGWAWMWVVTASTAAYFCGTVPYIKSMIRERFNRPLLVGTVAAHALVAAAAVWLAAGGCLGWPHAVVWVALAVRSLVMPLRQWKLAGERRPMPPRILGRTEMLFTAAFLITIAL